MVVGPMAKNKASLDPGPQICSNRKSAFYAKTKELLRVKNFSSMRLVTFDIHTSQNTCGRYRGLQFDYGYHGGLQIKGPGLSSGWGRLSLCSVHWVITLT